MGGRRSLAIAKSCVGYWLQPRQTAWKIFTNFFTVLTRVHRYFIQSFRPNAKTLCFVVPSRNHNSRARCVYKPNRSECTSHQLELKAVKFFLKTWIWNPQSLRICTELAVHESPREQYSTRTSTDVGALASRPVGLYVCRSRDTRSVLLKHIF